METKKRTRLQMETIRDTTAALDSADGDRRRCLRPPTVVLWNSFNIGLAGSLATVASDDDAANGLILYSQVFHDRTEQRYYYNL
jgi:hypothetical protein